MQSANDDLSLILQIIKNIIQPDISVARACAQLAQVVCWNLTWANFLYGVKQS